jgi:hypothetical protein
MALLELIVTLTWTCLCVPATKAKNYLFNQLFFDETVLSEVCSAASLCFCPGLFTVLQAAAPPSIKFFLGTPTNGRKKWAVYVLVLLKDGVYLIYIGSGTATKTGVVTRWYSYENRTTLPVNVDAVLKEGYEIVHKGMLIWIPLPGIEDVPRLRLLFLALEAMLAFAFWAMKSTKEDHCYTSCRLWSELSSFSYTGLCSHSALLDPVKGNFDLSDEQLLAIAAEIRQRTRELGRLADVRYRIKSNDKYKAKLRRNYVNGQASLKH